MKKTLLTATTIGAAMMLAQPVLAQAAWDTDGDGALGAEEFVAGFGSMGTFANFDADGNGLLDATEWGSGLTEVGQYENMDLNGDGGVDEAEYNALLFNRYDADGSGTIDATELGTIEADMTPGGMLGG
ncbi:EF-hand domain-containing protein [Jannaschia rubra]|uniref:EF hand n=1 Tax=Jannaschia rubra TaxID=282197 RepID=A0A0M6XPM0_9RHOB|nr:hypothetical protein [Jannaschia rubra]CTQ32848.1 EF hand [Jannaschia rubra]SFG29419.1 EF hand [Jannaschia rubra]